MVKVFKKVIACAMAAALTVGSVGYAAPVVNAKVSSPTTSVEPEKNTNVVTSTGAKADTKKDGTAVVNKVPATKATTVTIANNVKVDGVKYTVTVISANILKNAPNVTKVTVPKTVTKIKKNAFKGAAKLKTVVINTKKAITVQKGAFKGLKTKNMTIKVNKNMTNKQLKKFRKTLKAAGFNGTVKRKK